MLHTIRQLVDDDARWRAILRGLTTTFRHRTVTGARDRGLHRAASAGLDLRRVFAQYLTTTKVPEFEYRVERGTPDLSLGRSGDGVCDAGAGPDPGHGTTVDPADGGSGSG